MSTIALVSLSIGFIAPTLVSATPVISPITRSSGPKGKGKARDVLSKRQKQVSPSAVRVKEVQRQSYYSPDTVHTLGEPSSRSTKHSPRSQKAVPVLYEYNFTTGEWEVTTSWNLNGVTGDDIYHDDQQPDSVFQDAIDANTGLLVDTSSDATPATTTQSSTPNSTASASSSSKITVPVGWQPPKRSTNFYASHIIIGVSVVLAVMIIGLMVVVVGWRKQWSFGVGRWGRKRAKEKKIEGDIDEKVIGKRRRMDKFRNALRRRRRAKRNNLDTSTPPHAVPISTSFPTTSPFATPLTNSSRLRRSVSERIPPPTLAVRDHSESSSCSEITPSPCDLQSYAASARSISPPPTTSPPVRFTSSPPAYITSSSNTNTINQSGEKYRYVPEGTGVATENLVVTPPVPSICETSNTPQPAGLTAHVATDEKSVLGRILASRSRPQDEEEMIGTPMITAPQLEVDDEGFEIIVTSSETPSALSAPAPSSSSSPFPLPPAPFAMPTYALTSSPSTRLGHLVAQGFPSVPEYDGPMTSRREEKMRASETEQQSDWRFRPSAPGDEDGELSNQQDTELVGPSGPINRVSMDRGYLPLYEPSASAPPITEEEPSQSPSAPPWIDGEEENDVVNEEDLQERMQSVIGSDTSRDR